MGNCTCLTPNPQSPSSNLSPNGITPNHSHSYDMNKAPNNTVAIAPNITKPTKSKANIISSNSHKNKNKNNMNTNTMNIFRKASLGNINEEEQTNDNNNNNNLTNQGKNIIKPKHIATSNSNSNNDRLTANNMHHLNASSFHRLEHSRSNTDMTPTMNTTTATTTMTMTTPSHQIHNSTNSTATTPSHQIDNMIIMESTPQNEIDKLDLEIQQNQTSLNGLFNKLKLKKKKSAAFLNNYSVGYYNNNNREPEYEKANSTETVSTRDSSNISTQGNGIDIVFIDEDKKANITDTNDNDNDSDSPGPLPELKLFNNSNRPPLWRQRRASSHESIDNTPNMNINIGVYTELTRTATDTPTTTITTMDTMERLKIPALTQINRSVSAFDELGKKLNRLPSFQRALTSASITSLNSMHSQSMHLSFDNTTRLTNGPSLHSINSLRTPTANSIVSFGNFTGGTHTNTNTNNNSTDLTPLTYPHPHPQMQCNNNTGNTSFENISMLNKAAMSPSLPSIDDKNILIQHQQSYSKSISTQQKQYQYRNASITHNSKSAVNPSDLVQKRVLFVSLVQLHRAYLNGIPQFILEHAIFAFGVKRIWIFPQTEQEIIQAKDSYIDYFKQNWSKEFIDTIKQKDEKGHVLWIEPCHSPKAQSIWSKISDQLTQIIDLSVSQEETERKKQNIQIKYKQLLSEQKMEQERKEKERDELEYLSDNDGVSRFPSDRTDSIPPNLPTISNQFDTNSMTIPTQISSVLSGKSMRNKLPQLHTINTVPSNTLSATVTVAHQDSFDIIPTPKEFTINDIANKDRNENENENAALGINGRKISKHGKFSISQTLLQIHTSKEDALKMNMDIDTVYMNMTDNELEENDEQNMNNNSSESDENETESNNERPRFGMDNDSVPKQQRHKPKRIKIGLSVLDRDNKNMNITPPDMNINNISKIISETKSRHSQTNLFKKKEKKMRIRVDTISEMNNIAQEEYMPYYNKLQLTDEWWLNKYEPIRRGQADKQKLSLAQSAKLISTPTLSNPSPHHNESLNLLNNKIKSLFNINGKEVLNQLKCIITASDIKLKPIKELFYQSNPTMIPMEYFELNKYIESHIDIEQKYFDILTYCERYLMVRNDHRNGTLTPSHSANQSNSKSNQSGAMANQNNMNTLDTATPVPTLNNKSDKKTKFELSQNFNESDNENDNDGFKIVELSNSNANSNTNLQIIQEINVDQSGMVYMFNYDDEEEDDDDDEQEIETLLNNLSSRPRWSNPSVPFQSSINSMRSADSQLPYLGKLHGKSSDSSILLFD